MMQRLTDLLLIRQGERYQVFYFLGLFFLIGAGMALGRGASEALFFKRFGIEYLPLMYIFSCISLCLVSLLYAAFVDRLPSEKFYRILFSLLAVLLLANWYAIRHIESDLVYPVFFLLYEVASELLLVHSAVYINQNFIQTQTKRLTPVILAGHQVGVIVGGVLLASSAPFFGVVNMMLLWVALLVLAYLLVRHWHGGHGVSPYFRAGRKGRSKIKQSITQVTQGLKFMKTSRLLLMSSFSLFFMVLAVYILAYSVNVVYTKSFASEESLSAFFGILTAVTGALALFIQLFFTNRLIRDIGIKKVNYIFPVTSILSYASLLFAFALPAAILASVNKETLMPAFAKPVRNIFNASLPAQLQGRGQAIAVIIVIPLGLAGAGILLLLAQGAQSMNAFLIIGLICSIAYLYFNREMNRAYAREILSNLKKSLFIPEQYESSLLKGNHENLLQEIEQGFMSQDDDISLVYARVLSESQPQRVAKLVSERMATSDNALKDRLVKIMEPLESSDVLDCIRKEIGRGDAHLDATILRKLFKARDDDAKSYVSRMLKDENPRVKAAGIYGALCYPMPALIEQAVSEWIGLLENAQVDNFMPAVELIVPEFKTLYQSPPLLGAVRQKLDDMLCHKNSRFAQIALNILAIWPADGMAGIEDTICSLSLHQNWMIRRGCINVVHLLPEKNAKALLLNALEDSHPNVRIAVVEAMAATQADNIYFIRSLLIEAPVGSPKAKQAMLEYLMNAGCDARTMQSIGLALAREAVDLKSAGSRLAECGIDGDNVSAQSIMTLLGHALDERVLQLADLALSAVQSSNDEETISVIRAGLKSNDKQQFANALELLSMLSNPSLLALVMPLFDETGIIEEDINMQFSSLAALLGWIKGRSDPWLSECAHGLSQTLNDPCNV